MRLVPGTDTVPNAVNKYLLPHEHQVITVRKHPAVLLKPILIVLLGLVIAAVISTTVGRHQSGVIGGGADEVMLNLLARSDGFTVPNAAKSGQ